MSKRAYGYYHKGRPAKSRKTTTTTVTMPRRRRKSSLYYRRRNFRTAGFLGIETKFYDTALASTALPAPTDASGGEFDPTTTSMITTPAVGDGEQNRDGKQIVCKYIELACKIGSLGLEATTGPAPGIQVFIALVLDKQTNAAQMNSEDCFKNLTAAANGATLPLRNLLFGKRFRILKQVLFHLNIPSLAQNAANDFSWNGFEHCFRWFVPLNNLRINFNAGTTSSIANVVDNSVHVIAYTNTLTGNPFIMYNARLRFQG